MTRIVLDQATLGQLRNLSEPLEVYDEAGKLRGRFTPTAESDKCGRWEPPPLSEEELRRRESGKRYTTAEVLAHLRSL